MTSEWHEVPLRELVGYISKGIAPSYAEEASETTIRVLNQKCNRNFRISYGDSRLHDTLKKKVPPERYVKPDDILINSTGAGTAGRIAQIEDVPSATTIDGHMILIRSNGKVTQKFLSYALKAHQWEVLQLDEGSTGQTELNRDRLLDEIMINYPVSFDEQNAIVGTLESIDRKLIVNKEINDNLQQQLFSLYENMATASPCLKEYTLSNLCDFQEGYVNPPQTHPEYFDGEVKWLRAVDINESFIIETSRTLTKAGFESAKKSALLFEPNTIAISKSGTIGRLGIIADYMCGNRAVINIAPHDTNMLAFIYCFLKSKQREFPDMAVGSVQKNLYVSLLEPLSVSIPDNESLTAFNAVGASILGMIHNNCVENTDLANLRDTILPKLMSGEIDVSSVLL